MAVYTSLTSLSLLSFVSLTEHTGWREDGSTHASGDCLLANGNQSADTHRACLDPPHALAENSHPLPLGIDVCIA